MDRPGRGDGRGSRDGLDSGLYPTTSLPGWQDMPGVVRIDDIMNDDTGAVWLILCGWRVYSTFVVVFLKGVVR